MSCAIPVLPISFVVAMTVVLVAEVAGHKRLETTRRYSLPSLDDRERAMEGLQVDY